MKGIIIHQRQTRQANMELNPQSIPGEKGSRSSKYIIMIYDPASDKVLTQERTLSTMYRRFTNRPKITKVLSNFSATTKNYDPVSDKLAFI